MLHNIDPILSPDLLHALRSMGHGDEISIVDANFPGSSQGVPCIRADGSDASAILKAILSVMPLDDFDPSPAIAMKIVGAPSALPKAVVDFQNIINQTADNPAEIQSIERFAFYERTSFSYAVVQTGEYRLYGNIILKKGVIRT